LHKGLILLIYFEICHLNTPELNPVWNNFLRVQKSLTIDGNPLTTTLATGNYWSSSELYYDYAWHVETHTGDRHLYPKSNVFYVRAIRAF